MVFTVVLYLLFPRLTTSGPFIEDENQRDIHARILKVHWKTIWEESK